MAFDEEMEVSGAVKLELERRLACLQKATAPLYPPRHDKGLANAKDSNGTAYSSAGSMSPAFSAVTIRCKSRKRVRVSSETFTFAS